MGFLQTKLFLANLKFATLALSVQHRQYGPDSIGRPVESCLVEYMPREAGSFDRINRSPVFLHIYFLLRFDTSL